MNKTDAFSLPAGARSPEAILTYLDNSAYDGLSEVDLPRDWLHVLYREEDKFTGPANDCVYSELRAAAAPPGGAADVVRVYRSGGALGRFLPRIFYLEEQRDHTDFYVSLQELPEEA